MTAMLTDDVLSGRHIFSIKQKFMDAMLASMESDWNNGHGKDDFLARAVSLASFAHQGQFDRAGTPYIVHALHVGNLNSKIWSPEEKAVGMLHDVTEDKPFTLSDLRYMRFPEAVVDGVGAMQKTEGKPYFDGIESSLHNRIFRVVKPRDNEHNADLSRLPDNMAAPSLREKIDFVYPLCSLFIQAVHNRRFNQQTSIVDFVLNDPMLQDRFRDMQRLQPHTSHPCT